MSPEYCVTYVSKRTTSDPKSPVVPSVVPFEGNHVDRRQEPRSYVRDWLMWDFRGLPEPLDFLLAGLFFGGSAR